MTIALTLTAAGVSAAFWPQYRGPFHDGSSAEEIRTDWGGDPPVVLWRRPIEPGWSSCVTDGQRLYTQVRRTRGGADRELAVALDTRSGSELWSRDVGPAGYDNLAGYDDRMDGPRSTPSVDGGRVYVLTSRLALFCLEAETGAVVWSRDFPAEFPGTSIIAWQNAASPLVRDGRIFLNANTPGGRMTAVRASDGGTLWRAGEDVTTHASPAWWMVEGEAQVVFLTLAGLVGRSAETGAERWRFSFTPSTTSTAATPVPEGEHVYASAAYARGAWSARVTRQGEGWRAEQAWRQQGNLYQNHWATPVAYQGHLYSVAGPSPGTIRLACLEAATGQVRWSQPQVGSGGVGFGSVIRVSDHLLVLTESGELVLVRAQPSRYEELGRARLLQAYCWNHPAFAAGRLYARSSSELVAVDLAPRVPPLPALQAGARRSDQPGRVRVSVRAADGESLSTAMASRLELAWTDQLTLPVSGWPAWAVDWTLSDGGLETEIEVETGHRMLIVRERR